MDVKTYTKRLQTIQNMTDTTGVKELCEILMDLLDDIKKDDIGFNASKDEK